MNLSSAISIENYYGEIVELAEETELLQQKE